MSLQDKRSSLNEAFSIFVSNNFISESIICQ